mmetsp:Transcript_13168/g.25455  ORF Transcript_13168/g.25455 Transcript_13168/m.25455 type:complete len:101 (+) Transcript_13168:964-1266(+)
MENSMDVKAVSPKLGQINLSTYTHKSYIRHLADGKWRHIITIEGTMSCDHAQIMSKMFKYCQRHAVTKEHLYDLRTDWLHQLNEGCDVNDLDSEWEQEHD